MREHYDFSQGERGKYAAQCLEGTKVAEQVRITAFTDDEGPRLVIEGCGFCGEWRVTLWETGSLEGPEGSCIALGDRFDDILDAADQAEFWARILKLPVQTEPDHLEHLKQQEKAFGLEEKGDTDHAE